MAKFPKTQCFCLLGVGKTTLVKKVCDAVVSGGVSVSGFYTEEVRERGRRVGFDVVTLTGDRGRLSRIGYCLCSTLINQPLLVCMYCCCLHKHNNSLYCVWSSTQSAAGGRECRVGQYAVDLQSFESLALPLFRNVCIGGWILHIWFHFRTFLFYF